MLQVVNKKGTILAYLNNALEGVVKETLNGEYVLSFVVTVDPLKTEYIYDKENLISYDNNLFKVLEIQEIHNDTDDVTVSVDCEHISYSLIKTTFDNFNYPYHSAIEVMNACLMNTDFRLRNCDVTEKTAIQYTEECNAKQISIAIASNWNAELRYDNYHIDLLKSRGKNRGVGFIFGKNIKNVKRLINLEDDTVTYEVDLIEHSELDELSYYELGDTVRVIDMRLNIDIEKKITSIEKDIVTGLNSNVVLGDSIKDLRSSFSTISKKVEEVNSVVSSGAPDWNRINSITNAIGEIVIGKKDELTEAVSKIINSSGTFYQLDTGMYWQDQPTKENSTFASMWGPKGMIYATKKDEHGEWIWSSIFDGEGVIANRVTVDALYGMLIEAVNITGSTITGGEIIGTTIKGSTVMAGDIVMTGNITWNTDSSPAKAQYSRDGNSNWHSTFVDGQDLFARYTYDGGQTWSSAIRIVGSAYRVEIVSSNGNIFKNGNISTVLSARVYNNEEDVTDTINASAFKWTKINSDGSLDTAWNTQHAGGTKTIKITSDDVYMKASFTCDVDL